MVESTKISMDLYVYPDRIFTLPSWNHIATNNVLYLVPFKDVYSDCSGAEPIVQIANDMLSYSSWYVACAFQPRLNKPRATNIYCM